MSPQSTWSSQEYIGEDTCRWPSHQILCWCLLLLFRAAAAGVSETPLRGCTCPRCISIFGRPGNTATRKRSTASATQSAAQQDPPAKRLAIGSNKPRKSEQALSQKSKALQAAVKIPVAKSGTSPPSATAGGAAVPASKAQGSPPTAVQRSAINQKGLQLVSQKGRKTVRTEPQGLQRPSSVKRRQKGNSYAHQQKGKWYGPNASESASRPQREAVRGQQNAVSNLGDSVNDHCQPALVPANPPAVNHSSLLWKHIIHTFQSY